MISKTHCKKLQKQARMCTTLCIKMTWDSENKSFIAHGRPGLIFEPQLPSIGNNFKREQ